jgi:secreted Zn-dependent insulinase-like peptidase
MLAFTETLKEMTSASFQSFKTSRLKSLAESDKNLSQENSKFYGHVSSHYYDFDHKVRETKALESLELIDIIEFYESVVKSAGRFVVWMKSVKKCGEEWGSVDGTEVVEGSVEEFKNGLVMSRAASRK